MRSMLGYTLKYGRIKKNLIIKTKLRKLLNYMVLSIFLIQDLKEEEAELQLLFVILNISSPFQDSPSMFLLTLKSAGAL